MSRSRTTSGPAASLALEIDAPDSAWRNVTGIDAQPTEQSPHVARFGVQHAVEPGFVPGHGDETERRHLGGTRQGTRDLIDGDFAIGQLGVEAGVADDALAVGDGLGGQRERNSDAGRQTRGAVGRRAGSRPGSGRVAAGLSVLSPPEADR